MPIQDFSGLSLTTITLFIPMVGLTILLFMNENSQKAALKWVAFGFSIVTFLSSVLMWASFDPGFVDPVVTNLQHIQKNLWLSLQVGEGTITSFYYVGVDGMSLLLVLLTTFIMPIAILGSFGSGIFEERGREKLYYIFLMLLEFAMIGVFVAQDLIIFYIFWEVTLVPMYFLIGIWGSDRRVYAAIKFFLYTMAGSILMLIAILFVGNTAQTFSLPEIINGVQSGAIDFPFVGLLEGAQSFLFLGFLVAFAIKVPIWPLHSWLPDAHVQAPTAGSVILAGVLLKMGTYGIVRFCLTLFPEATVAWAPTIAALGVIGILYGAWVSYAQTDVKKLVAYSSVSHLGFVVVGIFALNAQGLQGATLQMVNHGISTGGLFLLVGMLYERYHTKDMEKFGGIWKVMPMFGALSLVVVLSSMGLPGLNGFVGEFTILLGSLGSDYLGFFFTLFSTLGVILAAVYMLYMFQKVYMGEARSELHHESDYRLKWNEIAALVPILIMIFWIGLQPIAFFNMMDTSVNQMLEVFADPAKFADAITSVAMLIP